MEVRTLDKAMEGIKMSLEKVADNFKKGLDPIIYWFHRRGLVSPESCIRRGCKDYHGRSPGAHLHFLMMKQDSFFGICRKVEESHEQTYQEET